MSDKFVTVATYYQSFVAQLAKNLLENEGIDAILTGELASEGAFGRALGDQIILQVHEDDAQRAASILATVESTMSEDWEEQAESGSDVWICSLCGEPISNQLSRCYSCETPRDSIRADAPHDRTAIQSDPATRPTGEEVQKRDEIARAPLPMPTSPPPASMKFEPEEIDAPSPMAVGDDLARHAFGAAFFGFLTVLLLPLSWYYLVRLFFFSGDLSPKGLRYFYGALLINGLFVLFAVVLAYAARVYWL